MKIISKYIIFIIFGLSCKYLYSQTQSENYLRIRTYHDETGMVFHDEFRYFDGLGRPKQIVLVKASPEQKDIVQPFIYDVFGVETYRLLPYTVSSSTNNGAIRPTPSEPNPVSNYTSSEHYAFYNSSSNPGNGLVKDSHPYSKTIYEASPLNRVMEQGAPGAAWQPKSTSITGSGHTVKYEYGTNTASDVYLYYVDNNNKLRRSGYYSANQLFKTIVKNENENPIEEYTDKLGRVVLKREHINHLKQKIDAIASKTVEIASKTEEIANQAVPADQAELASQAAELASQTAELANQTAQMASQTELASKTAQIASKTAQIANKAAQIANHTGQTNQTELAVQTELANQTAEIANQAALNAGATIVDGAIAALAATAVETYYVYDDFGRLRFVISPEASRLLKSKTNAQVDYVYTEATIIEPFCYYYQYDNRNRMTLKKVPGANHVLMVYDKADRLIFSQDGNQRIQGYWLFSIPDAFGRVVLTGRCKTASGTIAVGAYDNKLIKAEFATSGNANKGYNLKIDDSALTLGTSEIYTVNYYDNYSFLGRNNNGKIDIPNNGNTKYETPETGYGTCYGNDQSNQSWNKGLLTGTLTAQISSSGTVTGDYLYSVIYYDYMGRPVQIKSNNHAGKNDKEYIAYNFTGQPTKTKYVHQIESIKKNGSYILIGTNTYTEIYNYIYDHAGRLTKTTLQLDEFDGGSTITLSQNTFNELGQLKNKKVGGTIQEMEYKYNIRGWLTQINDPASMTINKKFAMKLHYNDPISLTDVAQYNGNISGIQWRTNSSSSSPNSIQAYGFKYDDLNRLTSAVYGEAANFLTNKNNYDETIGYSDLNGNIKSITRKDNGNEIDKLTLDYSGNRLIKVTDNATGTKSEGFYDGNNTAEEYTYDANGNLKTDKNKLITLVEYNYLNLPRKITGTGSSNTIEYIYDANGQKLMKKAGNVETHYLGNFVYERAGTAAYVLKYILHPEGRFVVNAAGTGGTYEYNLKDHLGNVRVVVNQNNQEIQQSAYYPLGMTFMKGGSSDNKYLYNGKELQEDITGTKADGANILLENLDYSARFYDPQIGRFTTQDPATEMYYSTSPYMYVLGNPLKYIDPTGMFTEPIYDWFGNHLGNTQEGFTGLALVYSGNEKVDFSTMSAAQAREMEGMRSFDDVSTRLNENTVSKIYTHLASGMEGAQVYDETFSMSSIEGSRIFYNPSGTGSWNSQPKSVYAGWNNRITGTNKYSYETTVENVQSSVVVHEWYTHIMKGQGNHEYLNSHRLAYKNVINYKQLWEGTTDAYKKFNLAELRRFTQIETGRTTVDPPYRRLYNKYVGN